MVPQPTTPIPTIAPTISAGVRPSAAMPRRPSPADARAVTDTDLVTAPALGVAGLLLAAVVVADLVASPRYVRRVRVAVAAGDTAARTRMYRLTIALSWSAALGALVVLLAGGLSASEIGLGWPRAGTLERYAGPLVGAVVGIFGGGLAMVLAARRGQARSTSGFGDVDVLLPRSAAERRWFAFVAVTAGITEELFYRALALTLLLAVLPGDARWPAVLIAAAMFAAAHAYQGAAGVAVTAVLAVALGWIYVDTGSLLPGMVVHTLLDLRALLGRPAADPASANT